MKKKEVHIVCFSFYQDLAIGTLFACYKENILSTWILLIQQIPVWGNESCITIAMKTKNRQFVQQKACSDLNKYVWNNYKGLQLQDLEVSRSRLCPIIFNIVILTHLKNNV